MQRIITAADLKSAIKQLEYKQEKELSLLKQQFHDTYVSLKPINIIKNTFKEFTASPDFKDNLIGSATGLTAGYLSKALVVGTSHNPITKLFGTVLQMGITNIVSKNPETIKGIAGFVKSFLSKKEKEETI